MVQADKNQKQIFRVSLLMCVTLFLIIVFLGYTYLQNTSQMLEDAKENAEAQAKDAAGEIGSSLGELITISRSIEDDLSSGKLQDEQVRTRLKNTLQEHPDLYGVVVAYEPYAYNSTTRLYAPYYVWEEGEPRLIQVEDMYDYTNPDIQDGTHPRTDWYHQPLDEGAGWVEPYFGTASDTFLALYGLPFYHTNVSSREKMPVGITAAVYSLDGVRDMVDSLDMGDTGYGFIITEKGTIVSHPIQKYLGRNIADLQQTDKTLQAITQNIVYGEHQVIYNMFTGQTSWVFYEPIPSTNWTLGVVFVEDETFTAIKTYQRHLLYTITIAAIAFLFFLSILILGAYKGNNLWTIAIFFSVLCMIGMCFIWYLALDDQSGDDSDDVVILDQVGLEVALHKFQNTITAPSENPGELVRIPTGIFLQSLEFSSANNVIVTGYIWQDDPYCNTSGLSPGVIFPEAEQIQISEAYEDGSVRGWYFWAVLRQSFDYSKYPFDCENIWIRMWHKDFQNSNILVPDLDSYEVIRPDTKPGIEKDFVLEGWEMQDSFFSYRINSYNTDFGIEDRKNNVSPELYFNVGTERNFMSSFISDMVPIIVVTLLLFAVLMISTKHKQKKDLYGFDSSTVLAYCAALFFVLIISNNSLREKLQTDGIIYLEYFYFILYFAILVVSVNSILLASNTKLNFIHYKDNLIMKLLFWPVITMLALGITLVVFY